MRIHLPMMIAHDQTEENSSTPITAFTTMSAFMNSVSGDMSMPGAAAPVPASRAPSGGANGIVCGVGSTGAAFGAWTQSPR